MKQTTITEPSQWIGETEDRRDVYVRFRHGWLRVEVGGKRIIDKQVDPEGDPKGHNSWMTADELQAHWSFIVENRPR